MAQRIVVDGGGGAKGDRADLYARRSNLSAAYLHCWWLTPPLDGWWWESEGGVSGLRIESTENVSTRRCMVPGCQHFAHLQ